MGYWEEKRKFEEIKNANKCPKCKNGNMVVETTSKRSGWTGEINKIIYTSFCPRCGHTIKKEVKV